METTTKIYMHVDMRSNACIRNIDATILSTYKANFLIRSKEHQNETLVCANWSTALYATWHLFYFVLTVFKSMFRFCRSFSFKYF